jgi:hypothetical protein
MVSSEGAIAIVRNLTSVRLKTWLLDRDCVGDRHRAPYMAIA